MDLLIKLVLVSIRLQLSTRKLIAQVYGDRAVEQIEENDKAFKEYIDKLFTEV